jgi:hypothetical protein
MSDADLILTSGPLELRAMDDGRGWCPAKQWYQGLERRLQARVLARLDNISNSLQRGRPDQALAVLRGSRVGLLEMRVTPAGGRPPHLRLFVLRRGWILWAAGGMKKQANRIKPGDWRSAENLALEWLARRRPLGSADSDGYQSEDMP